MLNSRFFKRLFFYVIKIFSLKLSRLGLHHILPNFSERGAITLKLPTSYIKPT